MASNVGLDHALKSILHEYLHEGECGQDTSTYAGRLTGLCSPNDEDSAEMFCWTLWKAFIEIAQTVPSDAAQSHIDKLVHLVKAIKESKPLRNSDGGNVTVWGGECWKDLPVLGPAMREHSNTMRK